MGVREEERGHDQGRVRGEREGGHSLPETTKLRANRNNVVGNLSMTA